MKRLKKFLADNGLLVTFTLLFICCLIGQMFSGAALYNSAQSAHGLPPVKLFAYARNSVFLQGMFSNWQAAILQLGALITFGIFLHQRGAPHSLRLESEAIDAKHNGQDARRKSNTVQKENRRRKPSASSSAPGSANRRGIPPWLHKNSLSLAFGLLFLAAFAIHIFSGASAYNRQQQLAGQQQLSVGQFCVSSQFWFTNFQTWEAEFMAIALYVGLSICLRQEGSPESKPVEAPDSDTADANK